MRAERPYRPASALVSCITFVLLVLVCPEASVAQSQQPAEQPVQSAQKSAQPSGAATTSTTSTPTRLPAVGATAEVSGPRVPGSAPPEQDGPVIVNADLVTVTVTVTDAYGRYVTGLGKNAFTIFDDKEEQQISFFSNDDAPVSLGVVFDVSNSMSGEKILRAREALSRFIETSHNNDEYFLIGFNTRAQLLLDRTRDSNALLDKLTFVQTKGRTALYDACYLGLEKVTRGAHQKRAVLLISDGQDNSSRYTFSELRRLLKESDVIIYSIGILNGHDDTTSLGMGGRAILDELAGVSGGKSFYPSTAAEMNDTFEKIALELRNQYSIGYRPSNFQNDGKWHKLKVKIKAPRGLPRLFWRNKEGYYAVTNPR
ncbi:MAG TPA: VWA domain-containing protein [Pyrinomonadaceae bacterium]|jgi:Ca-activated chloride channel family protein